MRASFLEYADIICSDKPILSLLENLKNICAQNSLFHEEAACVEKIIHITHDFELYQEIGDMFMYKVRNRNVANIAYNKYMQKMNPDFYNKYASNLKALGFNCTDTADYEDDLPSEIINLCDRFDLIVYMMICLHRNNDYDGVLELINYLSHMKNQILEYKEKNPSINQLYFEEVQGTEKHLSEVLSETQNHNDINKFAICLYNKNKKAYFNIIKDYITYKKETEALDYYNNTVCPNLDYQTTNNIRTLCWITSDFYRDIYDFYNAVFMQKIALESELQENNINA